MLRNVVFALAALAASAMVGCGGTPQPDLTSAAEAIVYTVRFPEPATQIAEVEATIPTGGAAILDVMLPVWSPGYYKTQDYAASIQDFAARSTDGTELSVEKTAANRWAITTGGASRVAVSYRLLCTVQFVTGNWVGESLAVLNGPSTFVTLDEDHWQAQRLYEVRIELPDAWPQSMSSLETVGEDPNHYRAPDYDTLIDSPLVAGALSVHAFEVDGAQHLLVDFGDLGAWDGAMVADQLRPIMEEHSRFLGGLPFEKYVFLNWFREGPGGLEHLNSSLLSSPANPPDPLPSQRWLSFVSHEYFHAFNVKRLRPIELGPFDYEALPSTPSLWVSEGLTSYYGELAVVRSGVSTADDFLASLSRHIESLQTSPGRLVQTVEQASLTVGNSPSSGIGGDRDQTVSYYRKGLLAGLLIDARIRRLTDGRRSLDDVMRLAIERHSGDRGFRPEEFVNAISEIAGSDLSPFVHQLIGTTEELDYSELLDWYGLEFAEPDADDTERAWTLQVRPDATPEQQAHLQSFLAPTAG